MRPDELRQGRGVLLVPAAVFFVEGLGIVAGAENLGVDQVAVRLGIVRLQFQGPAVAGDRFVQLPLVLEGDAQVAVCLGIVRLQFQGPAVAGDRFVQLPWSFKALPRLLCASA